MSAHPPLDLRFTPELRSRIESFLASITGYRPTLVLLKGRRLPYAADRWDYGAYAPDHVRFAEAELRRLGRTLVFAADGFEVAVPQFRLIDELTGKTLGLGPCGLALLSREA